jgi:glucokinase
VRQNLAIGIDLGGTQIRAAIVSIEGDILERAAVATPANEGPEVVLAQIFNAVKMLTKNLDGLPIGVASPGPLDTKRGVAMGIPTLVGFDNFPLGERLQQTFGCKVHLTHDGIAAAVGEWKYGAAIGCDDFVYITVSTGIGGGVVSGGQILQGRKGMAGHIGHFSIVKDGALCNCGRRGCWEAYASGPAFENRARLLLKERTNSILNEVCTARDIFSAASDGDTFANELVEDEAELLGVGIVNLLHAYDPTLVVLGGGMSQNFTRLEAGILQVIKHTAMPAFRDVVVRQAKHIGNSGLLGAAALAFQNVL